MGVLRNLENKLESLVEGLFSRTFKSRVQPVELARRLAKEMESHKTVSISRTYVPNEYTVFLSPDDYDQIASYDKALSEELASYLLEHAQREELTLLTRPLISFESDDRLHLGEFGIQTRLVKPPTEESEGPRQGELGQTMVYSPSSEAERPSRQRPAGPSAIRRAVLVVEGKRYALTATNAVIGRSKQCDIVVDDPAVSREHAQVTLQGEHWYVSDLDSSNGVSVNGRRTESARLTPGDELTLGTTQVTFDLE